MAATKYEYTIPELMACVIARDLRDNDFAGIGAASRIPMAALKLAQRMHAPNIAAITGGTGAIRSRLPYLIDSASDYRNLFGAEARVSMEDIVDMEVGGKLTFACFGAIQVDKFGNLNMLAVGDYKRPKVRGPGTVGLGLTSAFERYYIFLESHNKRILVDKVDFISGAGFVDGSNIRDEYVQPGSTGPCMAVTPLCVFDFHPEHRRMRLRSVHPGICVEQVIEQTGFEILMPDHPVPETQVPSDEEMRLLREEIDVAGALRAMQR